MYFDKVQGSSCYDYGHISWLFYKVFPKPLPPLYRPAHNHRNSRPLCPLPHATPPSAPPNSPPHSSSANSQSPPHCSYPLPHFCPAVLSVSAWCCACCYRFYARRVELCCRCCGGRSRSDSASWFVLRSVCEIGTCLLIGSPWSGGVAWRIPLVAKRGVLARGRLSGRWNWAHAKEKLWGAWVLAARRTCGGGMDRLRSSITCEQIYKAYRCVNNEMEATGQSTEQIHQYKGKSLIWMVYDLILDHPIKYLPCSLSAYATTGGMVVISLFKIGRSNPYFFIEFLLLALHDLLLLLVLDILDLIGEDLHFLQPEIDLLAQLVVKEFIHRSFLIVQSRFEGLMGLVGRGLREETFSSTGQMLLEFYFLGR